MLENQNIRPGQPIKASDFRSVVDAVNELNMRPMPKSNVPTNKMPCLLPVDMSRYGYLQIVEHNSFLNTSLPWIAVGVDGSNWVMFDSEWQAGTMAACEVIPYHVPVMLRTGGAPLLGRTYDIATMEEVEDGEFTCVGQTLEPDVFWYVRNGGSSGGGSGNNVAPTQLTSKVESGNLPKFKAKRLRKVQGADDVYNIDSSDTEFDIYDPIRILTNARVGDRVYAAHRDVWEAVSIAANCKAKCLCREPGTPSPCEEMCNIIYDTEYSPTTHINGVSASVTADCVTNSLGTYCRLTVSITSDVLTPAEAAPANLYVGESTFCMLPNISVQIPVSAMGDSISNSGGLNGPPGLLASSQLWLGAPNGMVHSEYTVSFTCDVPLDTPPNSEFCFIIPLNYWQQSVGDTRPEDTTLYITGTVYNTP